MTGIGYNEDFICKVLIIMIEVDGIAVPIRIWLKMMLSKKKVQADTSFKALPFKNDEVLFSNQREGISGNQDPEKATKGRLIPACRQARLNPPHAVAEALQTVS